jgi:hypothetical protein
LFGEELEEGYIIRKPKKGLLDYKGFIKSAFSSEADREAVMEAVSDHRRLHRSRVFQER